MRYVFGDCVLDTTRYVLYRAEQPVRLRPKVFCSFLCSPSASAWSASRSCASRSGTASTSVTRPWRAPSPRCGRRWGAARGPTALSRRCTATGIALWRPWRSRWTRGPVPGTPPLARAWTPPRLLRTGASRRRLPPPCRQRRGVGEARRSWHPRSRPPAPPRPCQQSVSASW
jgi:hypothetical protein